jgi:FkbM family methyltransferase
MIVLDTCVGRMLLGNDEVSRRIREHPNSPWDRHLFPIYREYLKKDSVIIEVGANIGSHTLYFSSISRQVFAFEPQLFLFEQLCGNLALNYCRNVTPINMAVYDKRARFSFPEVDFYKPNSAGSLGVTEDDNGAVESCLIDDYDFPIVNFIKIDTQGSDLRVLKGAIKTIEKHQPLIVFEVEREDLLDKHETKESDFVDFFNQLGYALLKTEHSDYLALPKGSFEITGEKTGKIL